MARLKDWPIRLARRLADQPPPFAWGVADCCCWAADVIRDAVTGDDVMAALRGTYSDREGAAAILQRAGGIDALWSQLLGAAPYSNPRLARSGDVGLVQDDGTLGRCVGIVHGGRVHCLAPSGAKAVLAWSDDGDALLVAWSVGW